MAGIQKKAFMLIYGDHYPSLQSNNMQIHIDQY